MKQETTIDAGQTSSARLSQSPLLTDDKGKAPLIDRSTAAANYPRDLCIHQLFEAQVKKTPDATALVFEHLRLTYRELNTGANQLAHHLQSLGVGPEVLVGICVERSAEMIFGLLGILKAGGAYLPLDPDNPKERRSFMLEDASASILITTRSLASSWPECSVQRILLDQPQSLANYPSTNPDSKTAADNLAYIIYTSGSTGRPKGVMIPHRGVTRLVTNTNYADFDATQTFLQFAPIAFDASTFEIWGALLNGAKLVIFPPERSSLEELARVIARDNITTLWLTAGLFHLMVDQHLEALTGLRQLLAGGDVLSVSHVKKFLAAVPDCRLINGYGPTENTTFTCCHTIPRDEDIVSSVPIGRPIASTQVYILDQHLNPVAIGVPGELYAGGAGLARGYLSRPELTAEKFVSHPFCDDPSARLYKTGDLARYLPDGNIEFLGRMDHQVKIRGFRIELGEIESVLNEHPTVKACVVIAREDQPNDKRLVAYTVSAETPRVASGVLREFLRQKLPDYMLPSAFIGLDKLPLTPSGKLDRKALPAPSDARPDMGNAFVAPTNSLESMLADIYSDVLNIKQIGIHDNFLNLGGHSLLAAQIVARVREALQIELPVRLLLEGSSVSALAAQIETCEKKKYAPLTRVARHGDLPVSFSQERAWFIQQLDPASIAYNFQATLRFTGQLDCAALERSLTEIVRRHEVLRTSFPEVNGRPVQVIHDAELVRVRVVDLQTLPEREREAEAHRIIEMEIRKRFDLAQLPLICWVLIRLGAHEHILLEIEHHLLHDGWSFHVFLGELFELYKAFTAGKSSPLPDLPMQFADFAIAQRRWMEGEEAAAQLAYWKTNLSGAEALSWLGDRPRPAQQTFVGTAPRIELSLDLCESLRALSRRAGVTLFMTMFAGFLIVLQRYTAQHDICVGSGIANRRWRETESMLGMILNNVVLRVDLSGDPDFRELLRRVQQVTLEAYANQDVPFDQVVRASEQTRDASRNPLFQVTFSFHDSPLRNLDFPKLKTGLLCPFSNGSAKFDLNVIVIPRAEQRAGRTSEGLDAGITLVWEYNSDLFDDATMRRMIGHYQTLLEGITANPAGKLSQLPLLTKTEHRQVLVDWNNTAADYPKQRCIQQLFEEQAEKTPDAVAAVFEDQQLSYAQLNRKANRLAHHLMALGVGPDVLAAVCVERSLEMVVALLGILKAGGAYLPLDPTYPKERLAFMLADSKSPILLTQSKLEDELPEHTKRVLIDQAEALARYPIGNPKSATTSDNLAYVIYTSGSTGRPKGVLVTHRGLCNVAEAQLKIFDAQAHHRILQFASLSFDAATFEIAMAWHSGAALYLTAPDAVLAGPALNEQLRVQAITHATLPPSVLAVLSAEALPALQVVVCAGEACSADIVARWAPGRRFFNAYGPTEATIWSTVAECHDDGRKPLIGRPIANTQVYILDPYLNPVPIGIPGELHIGGDGLARGYLDRPELTKEKFIPNPFSEDPDSRLYKTGDLARYLPDGNIEFLGRIDTQVKIRGFRIELGEIEAALKRHPAVKVCAVIAREDTPGDKRLVAYVVVAEESAPADAMLRDYLKQSLPDYMLPSAFVVLDQLPSTPNGKLDRKALPAPEYRSEEYLCRPAHPYRRDARRDLR